jgi:hypothetical protein
MGRLRFRLSVLKNAVQDRGVLIDVGQVLAVRAIHRMDGRSISIDPCA